MTDRFEERFAERTGQRPSWHTRHFANLKRLLGLHGAEELRRRIDVLFDAPPRFLAGSVPDFDTFVQHVDKLAAPAAPAAKRKLTPEEAARRAQELMAEEARQRAGGGQ